MRLWCDFAAHDALAGAVNGSVNGSCSRGNGMHNLNENLREVDQPTFDTIRLFKYWCSSIGVL